MHQVKIEPTKRKLHASQRLKWEGNQFAQKTSARLFTSFLRSSIVDNMTNKERQPISFSVRLCSDKAAFEVRIWGKISLNMADLEDLLRSVKENEIIVNTPHIVIFRSKGAEVTLSRNGRMLIKKVRNEKEATAVAREVLRVLSIISEDL